MDAAVSRWKIILNFACVYIVWGSTYLAIKYAIIGFSPFFMAFLRFITASVLLFLLSQWRKEKSLLAVDIKIAGLSGTLLVFANALVCLAEKDLSSGLVAVFVGTLPIWIMLFNWQFFKGERPRLRQVFGIVVSLIGIALLTQSQIISGQYGRWQSWLALVFAVLCWTMGTLIQRTMKEKNSLFRFSAVQMCVGSLVMVVLWYFYEGPKSLDLASVTPASVWALAYLILFGSVAAFSSYLWLNRHGDPTTVSTYALVNPLIAMWLGWWVAREVVTISTILFSLLVVVGIYFVVFKKSKKKST